jgi:hypothetical protein
MLTFILFLCISSSFTNAEIFATGSDELMVNLKCVSSESPVSLRVRYGRLEHAVKIDCLRVTFTSRKLKVLPGLLTITTTGDGIFDWRDL